ncbi:MAG: prepilin peptidase [Candidatus Omnitrophica bacterium]|nr:prepilin peptidase [Candidatus Omnitrophota bacterium]
MLITIIFIFGLLIGSFLNVCIYRMPKRESIVLPASHCPGCKKPIPWYDNIPLLSYIALGGKCRFCKMGINLRYPLVEALTASVLAALFVTFDITPKFFAYSIMACGLIVATFVDFEIQEIPDEISLGGIAAGFFLAFVFPSVMGEAVRSRAILGSLSGAITGGGIIYLLGVAGKIAFKKEAMGGGDVKLMAMLGSFLGLKLVVLTFFIAPFLGVVQGIILKFRKGAETIPYGPFLSAAALISVFFGDQIIRLLFGGLF